MSQTTKVYTDEELFHVADYALEKFWAAVESVLPGIGALDADIAGQFFTYAQAAIKSRITHPAEELPGRDEDGNNRCTSGERF